MKIKEKQRTPNAFFDCAALLTLCSGKEKSSVFRVGAMGAGLVPGLFLMPVFSTSSRSDFWLLFITKEERKSIKCM